MSTPDSSSSSSSDTTSTTTHSHKGKILLGGLIVAGAVGGGIYFSKSKSTPNNNNTNNTNNTNDTTKPSEDTTKPSGDTTKASEDTTKPSEDTTKPSEDTTKPSESTNNVSPFLNFLFYASVVGWFICSSVTRLTRKVTVGGTQLISRIFFVASFILFLSSFIVLVLTNPTNGTKWGVFFATIFLSIAVYYISLKGTFFKTYGKKILGGGKRITLWTIVPSLFTFEGLMHLHDYFNGDEKQIEKAVEYFSRTKRFMRGDVKFSNPFEWFAKNKQEVNV